MLKIVASGLMVVSSLILVGCGGATPQKQVVQKATKGGQGIGIGSTCKEASLNAMKDCYRQAEKQCPNKQLKLYNAREQIGHNKCKFTGSWACTNKDKK